MTRATSRSNRVARTLVAVALCVGAAGLGCGRGQPEPSARDAAEPPVTTRAEEARQTQADAVDAMAELDAPSALELCDKYFPHEPPTTALREVVTAFWMEEDCSIAGLFDSGDAETASFLNHVRNWSLELIGCESPLPPPERLHAFALSWLWGQRPLSSLDIAALTDRFMEALLERVPLEVAEERALRAALATSAERVPRCECPAQLDRCAGGAVATTVAEAASWR